MALNSIIKFTNGFHWVFVHPYTWTYKLWLYIYIYMSCCLGPQLAHCCTVVPSLRQPGCLHILVNFNVLRVSMVTVLMLNFVRAGSTHSRSVENTIGYSWNKFWRLRSMVNKMISWSTARVRPPEETSQKLTTFSGWTIETKTNKETPTIKPIRAGYTVGNPIAKSISPNSTVDSVELEPTKLKGCV